MTFDEMKARAIAMWEKELAFKTLALRHCNHSKKKQRLTNDIAELEWALAYVRGEIDE